jgi:hypothetical protein
MEGNIDISMMGEDFILWRCQHGGALDEQSIMQWEDGGSLPYKKLYERNMPLLLKLIRTYGACAVFACEGKKIIGYMRFYPKAIVELNGTNELNFCLQQPYPEGPSDSLSEKEFAPLETLEDKTLFVHCMMVGYPLLSKNPYVRGGIGQNMARFLIEWARGRGWQAIETKAYEDIPYLYSITGSAGKSFWQKLGFHVAQTETEHILAGDNEFAQKARVSAADTGMDMALVSNAYIMRLEL